MEKPTEERLADIESGITRLTKMHRCVFNVLLIVRATALLTESMELDLTRAAVSVESISKPVNRSIIFMFGAMTLMGVSVSMLALYHTTLDPAFRVATTILGLSALGLGIYAVFQYRRADSQIRVTEKTFAKIQEDSVSARESAKVLDDAIDQALAEWEELTPDDSVSESKSED